MRIAVEFLLNRVFSADGPHSGSVEWPPHPSRLFSALIAAAKETDMGGTADEALRWLERLPLPEIACGDALPSPSFPRFVPVNWLQGKQGRQKRLLSERFIPSAPLSNPLACFCWPSVDEWPAALAEIARRVARLGTSSSLVRAWVDNEQPETQWSPGEPGIFLGVPHEGRLDALEVAYAEGVRPPAPKAAPYRRRAPRVASGEWSDMLVYRRADGPSVDATFAIRVAEALRDSLIKSADSMGVLVPEIHGHAADGSELRSPHCAFATLPNVGHRHSDGSILGVCILVPNLPPGVRWKVLAAAGGLGKLRFSGIEWRIEECAESSRATLQKSSWQGPSRSWVSALPIQLPVWKEASTIIRNTCRRLGLPEPSVEACLHPVLAGSPKPGDLWRSRRTGRRTLTVHARLRFPVPVAGPLLIGVGRHFGLGLLKPAGMGQP